MSEEYLWDRSGPPDPEIEALERKLAPLGLGAGPQTAGRSVRAIAPARAHYRVAAAAAVVVTALGLARFATPPAEPSAWQMAGTSLRRGQVLRTGGTSVQLESDAIGRVDIAAGSEVLASGGKRLELRRGELRAFIWAPAREFVVDTPSARAVDLGCQYTLNVDERGDGLLKVDLGWVAFESAGRESFIPAGAECRTRKKTGPGIPWFEDSSQAFRGSLAAWEDGRAGALDAVLRDAGPHDGLSLWHVMTRARAEDRGRVFDRLAQLVSLPADATREGVVRGEAKSLDQCWNALGLENTGWWRGWERRWRE
jgi:ferric-dicitrate binding protein FerR (iron transport regulator)